VVLLDINMPGPDGLEVARRLRRADPDLPLGILTCLDGRDELLQAIPLGLADFLIKPITTPALRGFLGRCVEQLEQRGRIRHTFAGGAVYHPATGRVIDPDGNEHTLTRNEQRLLQLLLQRRDQLVETAAICRHLVDEDNEEPSLQGLRNLVHRLRGKIGREAITSRKDVGYRLPSA
jgi:DNA-binding response OmpR family regulator